MAIIFFFSEGDTYDGKYNDPLFYLSIAINFVFFLDMVANFYVFGL